MTDTKQQQMKSVVKNKLLMLNSFSASILELKRMKAKHRVLALQLNRLRKLKKGPKASQTAMVRNSLHGKINDLHKLHVDSDPCLFYQ